MLRQILYMQVVRERLKESRRRVYNTHGPKDSEMEGSHISLLHGTLSFFLFTLHSKSE